MKIIAAVIALSKIAPQPRAAPGRNKTPAPPRLWTGYRLSRRAWLASRCFVRLRILLVRLDICPPFSCVANIGAVHALNPTASAGGNMSPAELTRVWVLCGAYL